MCSLVAAYSDSEPEEETVENESKGEVVNLKSRTAGAKQDEDDSINGKAKDNIEYDDEDYVGSSGGLVNPFLTFGEPEDDDDDDESEEDEIDSEEEQSEPTELKNKTPLGNPFRETLSASSVEKHESVFEIPFLDQEIKKAKALERHVKMTQAAGTQEVINGKKICWNYRKGRCRFGHNCTFAHDSDIQQTVDKSVSQPKNAATPFFNVVDNKPGASEPYAESAVVAASPHLGQTNTSKLNKSRGDSDEDDDNNSSDRIGEGIGKKAKKRRPGLSQTLTPGKKVMKMYYQQQQQQGSNS